MSIFEESGEKTFPEFKDDIDARLLKAIEARNDMKQHYDFIKEWHVFFGGTEEPDPRMFLAFWGHRNQGE